MIFLISLILLIWFKTEAILEYGSLIGLSKFLKCKEFQEKKVTVEYPLTYPRFLRMSYDNFFIRMVTCPICICVWLSIVFSIVYGCLLVFPFICILSLMLYSITSILLDRI